MKNRTDSAKKIELQKASTGGERNCNRRPPTQLPWHKQEVSGYKNELKSRQGVTPKKTRKDQQGQIVQRKQQQLHKQDIEVEYNKYKKTTELERNNHINIGKTEDENK